MSQTVTTAAFPEQEFYLKEFRGKSFLFSLRARDLRDAAAVETLAEVCQQLMRNEARLIVLIETDGSDQRWLERLRTAMAVRFVSLPAGAEDKLVLEQVWTVLRTCPIFVGLWPAPQGRVAGQRLAVRLKVHKLVILDPDGGLSAGGGRVSFMNGSVLNELLCQPQAAGPDVHRPLLDSIRAALEGGVGSVSLCRPADVARELFTYEGRGTLLTLADYCRVEPLGLDDFYEAERLIQRGEREGYLKPRSQQETVQLLLHGYGARLGAVGGELAGFCALLPYPGEQAGEIVGLYTITRFQGEGIGGRLVGTMIERARTAGLDYVFACTSQAGASRLFERCGFRRVTAEQVPADKWQHYEPVRKKTIQVYRTDLTVRQADL
jgi:amino-acid N-acetyltransferase